jgi:hypothetical protein
MDREAPPDERRRRQRQRQRRRVATSTFLSSFPHFRRQKRRQFFSSRFLALRRIV